MHTLSLRSISRLVALSLVVLTALVALGDLARPRTAAAAGPTALGRTPWQMRGNNPIVSPVPNYGSHGHISYYNHVGPIPPQNDVAWGPAPNGATIGFGGGNASRLSGYPCLQALDYTFFQTFVDIPTGTTLTSFTISFSGMDDGSRITLFNSANPGGLVVPGSYVFLGGTGTVNLASYVVAGETNRVVITQIDDCPIGNTLQSASVVLNGTVVPPNQPPSITANNGSLSLTEGETAVNSGSFFDADTGQNVAITASVGTITKTGTNSGTWSWSNPANNAPDTYAVTVTANDGKGGVATTQFQVTVSVPSAPDFSQNPTYPSDACICTPLMMNTNVTGAEQWWVKAAGSSLTIELTAQSVNPTFGLTVNAQVYDPSGAALGAPIVASFSAGTAPGTGDTEIRPIATTPGGVYRIKVTTPGADPTQPHYKFNFNGASQAAIKSPSFASLEHQEPVRWFFNTDGTDTLRVRWFSDGVPLPTGGPYNHTTGVEFYRPNGTFAAGPSIVRTIAGGVEPDWVLTIGAVGPANAGQWAYKVVANSANTVPPSGVHYRLQAGMPGDPMKDAAIYLTPATWGFGSVSGTVSNSSGSGGVGGQTINLRSLESNLVVGTTFTDPAGNYQFNNLFVGRYRVEITPTGSATVVGPTTIDVFVACDAVADADFSVNRPPTANANGPYNVPEGGSAQLNGSGTDVDGNSLTFAWDLDNDGLFDDSTLEDPVYSAGQPGVYPVRVRVCDPFNACRTAGSTVSVNNIVPQASATGSVINEDGTATVTVSLTDTASTDWCTLTVNWGEGSPEIISVSCNGTVVLEHQYLDDDPTGTTSDTHQVTVGVRDDENTGPDLIAAVTVNNVAPLLTVGGSQSLPFGSTVNISASFTDPGTLDTWVTTIDWGDGSPVQTGSSDPIAGNHQYVLSGNQTVKVCVSDDDGGSDCKTIAVSFFSTTGKITAGVLRFGNFGRGGFNVQSTDGVNVKGELEYHNGSVNLHAHAMTSIAVSPDRTKGWFAGVLTDGRTFTAYVEDNGEPGGKSAVVTPDVFQLWVEGVLQNSDGKLTGGNVQIHRN